MVKGTVTHFPLSLLVLAVRTGRALCAVFTKPLPLSPACSAVIYNEGAKGKLRPNHKFIPTNPLPTSRRDPCDILQALLPALTLRKGENQWLTNRDLSPIGLSLPRFTNVLVIFKKKSILTNNPTSRRKLPVALMLMFD